MILKKNFKKVFNNTRNKIVRIKERMEYPSDLLNFGNNTEKYLRHYHGGLGDALVFSTLPEEFLKQKQLKTYMLKSTKTRNKEIFDLIWGCNPYIAGIKEGPWNAGDNSKFVYKNFFNNTILNMEYLHGLDPINKYPKIYYKPKKIPGLENCIAADLNSVTIKYDQSKLHGILKGLKKDFINQDFLWIEFCTNFQEFEQNNHKNIFCNTIQVKNIFHYCDIINSLYGFISFCSGSSHLSSAIKGDLGRLESICLIDEEVYNYQYKKGIYLFDNINYVKINGCIKNLEN